MNVPFRAFALPLLSLVLILPGLADKPSDDPLANFLGKLGYERVPLKRDTRTNLEHPGEGNNLYLDARVDGRKQKWLLDTGFSITCFDRPAGKRYQTLAELGHPIDDPVLGTISDTNFVLIRELQLGPMRLTNQPAQVKDLGNRWSYTEMDAVLGMDLLRRHHAVIDFLGKNLFLRAEEPDEKTAKLFDASLRHSRWIAMPTTESGFCNYVRTSIRAEPLRLLVDSGADFTKLDLAVAKRLGLKPEDTRLTSRGIEDRAAKSFSARVPLMVMPGLAFTNVPVLVSDMTLWQPKGGEPIDGLIGADWLAVYEAVLDCQTGQLYLRPPARPKK